MTEEKDYKAYKDWVDQEEAYVEACRVCDKVSCDKACYKAWNKACYKAWNKVIQENKQMTDEKTLLENLREAKEEARKAEKVGDVKSWDMRRNSEAHDEAEKAWNNACDEVEKAVKARDKEWEVWRKAEKAWDNARDEGRKFKKEILDKVHGEVFIAREALKKHSKEDK